MTESQITNGRTEDYGAIYFEALDANHTPLIIAQEACIENCNKLRRLAGQALLNAQMYPKDQFDVVCTGKKGLLCSAEVQETGSHGNSFGQQVEGVDDYFLVDPSYIQTSNGGFSYIGRIEAAIKDGAGVYYPADLKRAQ